MSPTLPKQWSCPPWWNVLQEWLLSHLLLLLPPLVHHLQHLQVSLLFLNGCTSILDLWISSYGYNQSLSPCPPAPTCVGHTGLLGPRRKSPRKLVMMILFAFEVRRLMFFDDPMLCLSFVQPGSNTVHLVPRSNVLYLVPRSIFLR